MKQLPSLSLTNVKASLILCSKRNTRCGLYPILWIIFFVPIVVNAQDAFISTWQTTEANEDITISTVLGETYNYTVDWGDGTITTGHTTEATHNYVNPGEHSVAISDSFSRIIFSTDKILSVDQWGSTVWTSMAGAFIDCGNLVINASDTPNLSQVTEMSSMFYRCYSFNQDINNWDVSNVTDMGQMFYEANSFNQTLDDWDVSNVTDMGKMFSGAISFNQNINSWNVSKVTDMSGMFWGALTFNRFIGDWDVSTVTDMSSMFRASREFNQYIGDWNVSSVTDMSRMFRVAVKFNQDIGDWDVSNITDMEEMFTAASIFNQYIGDWDVGKVTTMSSMFEGASMFNEDIGNWNVGNCTNLSRMFFHAFAFNQFIGDWDVSKVDQMNSMFAGASAFDQNIGDWDVAKVSYMAGMFQLAHMFNQDIGNWNVGNVTSMDRIFDGALVFNHNLSNWDVSKVTSMAFAFNNAEAFDQNLGDWDVSNVTNMTSMLNYTKLSVHHYDSLLIGWASQSLQSGIFFSVGINTYCKGDSARQSLIDVFSWDIRDGGSSNCTASFITSWIVDVNDTITIPTLGTGYNYTVDWGDGNVTAGHTGNASHIYSIGGSYSILISGDFPQIYFNNEGDKDKIHSIDQWGETQWTSMNRAFYGCENLMLKTLDLPNLETVTDMKLMFADVVLFDHNIKDWNVENVVAMDSMFHNVTISTNNYDALLKGWSTQNLQSGVNFSAGKSRYCSAQMERENIIDNSAWVIQDGGNPECTEDFITTWLIASSNETITIPTVGGGYNYNVNWGDGTVSTGLTGDATHNYISSGTYTISVSGNFPRIYFNNQGDKEKIISIDQWGAGNWSSMERAFYGCSNLNGQASDAPNLLNVNSLNLMFRNASAFNQKVNDWNTRTVETMDSMFFEATNFNQNLSCWNTRSVVSTISMFEGATSFNRYIGSWNTSKIVDMSNMFYNAVSFDQYIGDWNIRNALNMNNMFGNVTLSTHTYDAILINWQKQNLQNGVVFSGGNSQFCAGAAARLDIVNESAWNITDGGLINCNQEFITTWQTSIPSDTITIVTARSNDAFGVGDGYDYDVDWGDGSMTFGHTGDASHVYLNPGNHSISISGQFSRIVLALADDNDKIISIDQWGTGIWHSMYRAFENCSNLAGQATDRPNLTKTSTLNKMFYGASSFNQNISDWKVSSATNMHVMFGDAAAFNQDIGNWDVSNVINMGAMFTGASTFNQDIGNWDLANVLEINNMFEGATNFNQDIGNWDISNVTRLHSVFKDATSFNQDIGGWDVCNVMEMGKLFYNATSFDQNLGRWDVGKLVGMEKMFFNATLSTANYDSLLIGWESQDLIYDDPNDFGFTVYNFDGGNSTFCAGETARQNLINNNNWTFTDGGKDLICSPDKFISTWKTTEANQTITIPTIGSGYNYKVEWGDGTFNFGYTGNATHSYTEPGLYQISISGDFPRIYCLGAEDADKIISIDQWGSNPWTSLNSAFYNCYNLQVNAADNINLSAATDLKYMFANAQSFDQDIGSWNIENITEMDSMFYNVTISSFNYDSLLIGWASQNLQTNVSFDGGYSAYCAGAAARASMISNHNWNITDAGPCRDFITTWRTTSPNETISFPLISGERYNYNIDWGDGSSQMEQGAYISHVYTEPGTYTITISGLFTRIYFNDTGNKNNIISIDQWGTGKWTSMRNAFRGCINLVGQATDTPNLSAAKSTAQMFLDAKSFDQNINDWDVSSIEDMSFMFLGAESFNQHLSSWDVSNVTNMEGMFRDAISFDGNITTWVVGKVVNFAAMFQGASLFNQAIGSWNLENATTLSTTFRDAISFDQNIGNWDVSNVTNMQNMFKDAQLSTVNYDSLLIGWNGLVLQSNVGFHAGNSSYCDPLAIIARGSMIANDFWTITDLGECINFPANDDVCHAQAITLNEPPIIGNNTYSISEPFEPDGSCWFGLNRMNSVWYKFVAPESGVVTVSTDFPNQPLHDTHIAIYEAPTNCGDLNTLGIEVGCSEDDGSSAPNGWTSKATLTNLLHFQTYFIQVDGYNTAVGEFKIEVTSPFSQNCNLITSTADSLGVGTLRSALNCIQPGDTISFAPNVMNDTIHISMSELVFNKEVVIYAPATADVWIKCDFQGLLMKITPTGELFMDGLKIMPTPSMTDPAIINEGELTLENVVIISPYNPLLEATIENKANLLIKGTTKISRQE